MKKIIFLHSVLDVGGAERLRFSLLRNIDRTKYDIKVCCIGEKGPIGKKIEQLGYRVDELRQNAISRNPYITYRVYKYLKKEKPYILHSCLFNANFHGRIAGFWCRIPHLITEEHSEHFQYNGLKFLPYKIIDYVLSHITDFIICCSEGLRQDIIIKERLPATKAVTIENCIDLADCSITTNRKEIRKKYNINNELVFITVASLSRRKGHSFLIEALYRAKNKGYDFKCFFAGDGPLKSELQRKCYELDLMGQVIFLGNINNVVDYLNASDVFVLPSIIEGLSIALMEAMLGGLAPIVTSAGSHSELVRTGFSGTVVKPGNVKELEEALIFYLKNRDLIKEFGQRSCFIIKERYLSINAYTRKYYELWNKCNSSKR